jgi:hypothetical protein
MIWYFQYFGKSVTGEYFIVKANWAQPWTFMNLLFSNFLVFAKRDNSYLNA